MTQILLTLLLSHFRCQDLGGDNFRPYYMQAINEGTEYQDWSETPRGLLGQNPMRGEDECQRAAQAANAEYGIVCSRTGLNGWKPTIYTGTVPGRADFGYMGGSSIMDFEECLLATEKSSARGVCFWGGSQWYVSPIDREGVNAGPFDTVAACTDYTALLK
jgi:hypothetical protein